MTCALVIAVSLTAHTSDDGQSTWFSDVLLSALPLITVVGFFRASA